MRVDRCAIRVDRVALRIDRLALGIDRYALSIDRFSLYTDRFALRVARLAPLSVLRIDDAGNFWILEPALDASGAMHRRFRIIDPDDRHIAFADSFPVRPVGIGSPTSIGGSSIVRAFEDADGVPKVGVFRIRKED